jgi:dephospho-CoA kinase
VRQVVVVSGAPGAGKSTLAVPLARALGFPLVSKDVIKESLFDSLGQVDARVSLQEFQAPMGLGPVLEVDTSAPVDVSALAGRVQTALGR